MALFFLQKVQILQKKLQKVTKQKNHYRCQALKYADLNHALMAERLGAGRQNTEMVSFVIYEKLFWNNFGSGLFSCSFQEPTPDLVIKDTTIKMPDIQLIHDKSEIGSSGDSAFVGSLAYYLWSKPVLATRTVTNKKAKVATGGPLTPEKYTWLKSRWIRFLVVFKSIFILKLLLGNR